MGAKKRMMPSFVLTVLAFVGTIGIMTPNCLGWFYKPKKPEGLK